MASAQNDSEAVTEFAQSLHAYVTSVRERTAQLGMLANRLGDGWRDEAFEVFQQHFKRTQHLLEQFSEEVKSTIPHLMRDAETLREYERMGLKK